MTAKLSQEFKKLKTNRDPYTTITAALFVVVFAAIGVHLLFASHAATSSLAYGPTSPPVKVCGNATYLQSPFTSFSAAQTWATQNGYTTTVDVPAGNNTAAANNGSYDGSNTMYYFEPGSHEIQAQIQPNTKDAFIGGYSSSLGEATITGDGVEDSLFTQGSNGTSDYITVEYLTFEDYMTDENAGLLNGNSESYWTIKYNTVEDIGGGQNGTGGGATMLGSYNTLEYDCLTNNAQLGFNSWSPNGNTGVTVAYNEISNNGNATQNAGCGCDGGGKFLFTTNSSFNDNYIHDNGGNGIWGDTNNAGITMEGNYISNNQVMGIMYEVSYNALIENNTLVDNDWVGQNFGNAIYVSNSGGDSRVSQGGSPISTVTISNNTFTDNWGGITEWEDSNRYCGPQGEGDTTCTMSAPSVTNTPANGVTDANTSCVNPGSVFAPNPANEATYSPSYSSGAALFWDCRWRTQNVSVTNNQFNFTPADIPGCQASLNTNNFGRCGWSGTVAQYGDPATYSNGSTNNYAGTNIETAVAYHQNNVFSNNTYCGPWSFMVPELNGSDLITPAAWQKVTSYTFGGTAYNQDAGSTFQSSCSSTSTPPTPSPSVPSGLKATANSPTSVSLTWSASTDTGGPGLAGYNIYRNGTLINSSIVTGTSYTDSLASANTSYSYYVEAVDVDSNLSTASSTASVTTPSNTTTPPPPPSGYITDKTFEDGLDNMNAWYGDSVAQSSAEVHSGTHSLAVTGSGGAFGVEETWPGTTPVSGGSSYSFSSWLLAGSTSETISEQVTWVNSTGTGLGTQTIGSVADSGKAWANLTGTLSAPSGAATADLSFTGTMASSGEVHYLDDITIASSSASTPPPDTVKPTAPTKVTAVSNSSGTSVTVSWSPSTDNVGVAGYYVIKNGVTLPPTAANATSYTDNNVSPGNNYSYVIEAFDAAGNISLPSAAASVTTPAPVTVTPPPPPAPANLTATVVSTSQINLSWSETSTSVKAFEVYENGGAAPIATVGTTSYGVTNLASGTKYSFYVVASVGTALSAPSSTVSATTLIPPPAPTTATVVGTVTSSTTGKPIANVHVYTDTKQISAYTNSSGQYALVGIPPNHKFDYHFVLKNYKTKIYVENYSIGTHYLNGVLIP